MPEYDFFATVRNELQALRQELAAAGVREMIAEVAQRLGASEEETLAAMWRASKRHGETMAVFSQELRNQFAREAARAEQASAPASP
jgi:molybdopterin converting factor small subunit